MAKAKRSPVTTTESPAKPATSTWAEKKNGKTGNGNGIRDMESAIRARAYELYEKRGRHDGFHQDDWFQAEAEVRTRSSRTSA